jgi:hypothetical protein
MNEVLFGRFEIGFGNPANRTYPIIRYVLKKGPGCNTPVGIPFYRIIYITANCAFVFFHFIDFI